MGISILTLTQVAAADWDHWYQCYPTPSNQTLHDVATDGTNWVAVGEAGTVLVSPDGEHWSRAAYTGTGRALRAVTFAVQCWVAVGDAGTILTSTNAANWVFCPSGTTENFYGITYGNGRFLAVGTYGAVAGSSDGVTWTMLSVPNSFAPSLMGVAYGNGLFVAGGISVLETSTDGLTWYPQTYEPQHDIYSVYYDGGQFLAGRFNGVVFNSPDGTNWTATGGFSAPYINRFAKLGDRWLAAAGELWQSQDLTNWIPISTGAYSSSSGGGTYAVTAAAGKVVITGEAGNVLVSSDGTNFLQCRQGRPLVLGPAVYHAGRMLAPTSAGLALCSDDGWTWTELSYGASGYIPHDAVSDGTRVVVVGSYPTAPTWNEVRYSLDGLHWTSKRLSSQGGLLGVSSTPSGYIAVGFNGVAYTSTNGSTWVSNGIPGRPLLYGVAAGLGRVVAVGPAGTNYFSDDGIQWTSTPSATTNQLFSAVFGAGRFVASGQRGTVVWSQDGTTWTRASTGISSDLKKVCLDGAQFIIVGAGYSLSSPDAVNWTVRSNAPTNLRSVAGDSQTALMASGNSLYLSGRPLLQLSAAASPDPANLRLALTSQTGNVVALQSSPDLVHWIDQLTVTNQLGFQYLDLPMAAPFEFFRLRLDEWAP